MRGTFREAARVKVAAPPLSPAPSPTLPPPTNPSKEYIYAGGRLIATEEPAKADQTITFSAISDKTYGDQSFTLSASASSGLPVSFTVVAGAVSIYGSTLTITGAGPVTIRAEQAGNNGYNAAPGVTQSFMVNKATASITLGNLSQTYDGAAKSASATTTPTGLNVTLTYSQNGQNVSAPTNAGSYTVSAVINTSNYQGSATNTLVINKATATVSLSGLTGQVYDASPKSASATTTPVNLSLSIAYTQNGQSVSSPINAGSYAATATINDANYQGSATGTFVIDKASQTINFSALPDKTYGDAAFTLSASSSSGLSVSFSIVSGPATISSGSALTITGAGNVTVRASQAGNGNYNAATDVDRSFNVAKAAATVTLGSLSQTYDGAAKSATASTSPSGLSLSFAYSQNGITVTSPTNAGSYAVTATVNDSNYQGSATGTLVINKATPQISWNNPSDIPDSTPLSSTQLNASTNAQGTFVYSPPSGTVLDIGNNQTLSTTFTPNDTANYNSASLSVHINVIGCPRSSRSSFAANPVAILPGNQSTLSWDVPYAASISIGGVSGTFNSTGSTTVSPSTTTTYTLTAGGASVCSQLTMQTQVGVCPSVAGSQFTPSHSLIAANTTIQLSWNVPRATSVSIAGVGTFSTSSGSVSVTPTATTTYTLTATGATGCSSTTLQAGVIVQACPDETQTTFFADQGASLYGEISSARLERETYLLWDAPNATAIRIYKHGLCPPDVNICLFNGETVRARIASSTSTTGSVEIDTPEETTTYDMFIDGAYGCQKLWKQVTVEVEPTAGNCSPSASFNVDYSPFGSAHCPSHGTDVDLIWDVPNATSVEITDEFGNNYGTFGPTDSITVSPPSNTRFTLTANMNYRGDCSTFTMETTLEYCGPN